MNTHTPILFLTKPLFDHLKNQILSPIEAFIKTYCNLSISIEMTVLIDNDMLQDCLFYPSKNKYYYATSNLIDFFTFAIYGELSPTLNEISTPYIHTFLTQALIDSLPLNQPPIKQPHQLTNNTSCLLTLKHQQAITYFIITPYLIHFYLKKLTQSRSLSTTKIAYANTTVPLTIHTPAFVFPLKNLLSLKKGDTLQSNLALNAPFLLTPNHTKKAYHDNDIS
jgi:hypothetical protein